MAEAGQPLIARGELPAPMPPATSTDASPTAATGTPDAHRGGKPAAGRVGASTTPPARRRQLPIFGAETTDPTPADLAGLLAGPGRLDRMGGTARVRVRVDAAWRVHVLVRELVTRGLVVSWTKIENTPANDVVEGESAGGDDHGDEAAARDLATGRRAEADAAGLGPGDVADAGDLDRGDEEHANDLGPEDEDGGGLGPGEEDAGDLGARDPEEAGPDESGREPDTARIDTARHMVTSDDHAGFGGGGVFFEVRTAYSSRLKGLATGWPAAARRLFLDGPRLRLWVAAAGAPHGVGYALGLDPGDDPAIIDAALVRVGLQGAVSGDGRYYLITGRKRLDRLAELIGERPGEAPVAFWPGGVPA